MKKSKDPIVTEAMKFLKDRSDVGIKKYGTTLEENNKDDYLLHLQEELGDALNYIVKIRKQITAERKELEELRGSMFRIRPSKITCVCGKSYKI